MISRRNFLIGSAQAAAGAMVTLVLTPLISGCAGDDDGATTEQNPTVPACDGAGGVSTQAQGHTHTLCVPASDLTAPPLAGKTYSTSTENLHDHSVSFTAGQLAELALGQAVTVTTATVLAHNHEVSVRKATVSTNGGTPPPSGGIPY